MTQKFSQEPMKTKELYDYLQFFFTKEVEDEKHAKRIKMLARRTVTLSDVVVVVKALTEHQDNAIIQLMDKLQVQERVINQLGATDEHFIQAQEDYLAALKEREEAFKANLEVAAQAGKTEAEIANIEAVEEAPQQATAHSVTFTEDIKLSEH